MRKLKFVTLLIALGLITSCGYKLTRADETTTTTTTTTTTLDVGESCNTSRVNEFMQKLDDFYKAKGSIKNGIPTKQQLTETMDAIRNLRSYVRGLDLPTLFPEQQALVNSAMNYFSDWNSYYESNMKDLSVNNSQVIFFDATNDFSKAFNDLCW